MTREQKSDIRQVFSKLGIKYGVLDYVTGWFQKALEFCNENPAVRCAFVATNSICQGEQVGAFWKFMYEQGAIINFAHRTFIWNTETKRRVTIYCVIIGFAKQDALHKKLFVYESLKGEPTVLEVTNITPYLTEGKTCIVERSPDALSAPHFMITGNMPLDWGYLTLSEKDKSDLLKTEPKILPLIRRFVGGKEFLYNIPRFCLWLKGVDKETISAFPSVAKRVRSCGVMRKKSPDRGTQRLASRPHEFRDTNNPKTALLVPKVSAERPYIPMGFVQEDSVVSDSCLLIPNASVYEFGILSSHMHMAWVRLVCGRMGMRYRYSRDLCYNTFIWPDATEEQRREIAALAQKI
jgi:hypothetical protein